MKKDEKTSFCSHVGRRQNLEIEERRKEKGEKRKLKKGFFSFYYLLRGSPCYDQSSIFGRMDRIVQKDYEWLLSRTKTAYDILGIDRSATSEAIRKAYRQKALLLHPDKNDSDDAEELFREVVVSYTVLSDLSLKKQYDQHISDKTIIQNFEQKRSSTKKDDKVSKFKADLKKKEGNNKSNLASAQEKEDIEFTQWFKEAVNDFRRKSRNKLDESSSNDDIPTEQHLRPIIPTIISLKWKNRKEIQFDEGLIKKLMEVFGPVKSVYLLENDPTNHYCFADVDFKTSVAAALAVTHNYSKTADLWDQLNLRKISSLLREAELIETEEVDWDNLDPATLTPIDYIAYNILKDY